MRILHLVVPAVAGGAERVVQTLAVGHRRRGHRVTVGALMLHGQASHPFVDMLDRQGVDARMIHVSPRGYLLERRLVKRLCREIEPDVVHTHGYRIDVVDRPILERLGLPTVTTVHGRDRRRGLKDRLYGWLQRRNYRHFNAVVAVSRRLYAETLRDRVRRERLHYIPNAWGGLHSPLSRAAARRELGVDEADQVLGWVGRLVPVKGADIFLEAIRRLPTPRPTVVLIGYGPEASTVRKLASDLDVESSIRFYADIEEASRYFSAFDTFVLSSRSEGQPIVLLEAMAAGTPIVATDVGGVGDMISEKEGWLVADADPDLLSRAIVHSLSDRVEAYRRADHARLRLESDFAMEPWLDRYEGVYRDVVESDKGSSGNRRPFHSSSERHP